LSIPENHSTDLQGNEQLQAPAASAAIAPVWHTLVLVAGILAISIYNAPRLTAAHGALNRLYTYGASAAMEVVLLAWVLLGLRLKKTSLRSLLGSFRFSFRAVAADLGFAAIFWIGALMVLGTLNVGWSSAEAALTHRPEATYAAQQSKQAGQSLPSDPSRLQVLRELAELAPANGKEIAAWTLLCLLVGFIEEVVFRGYLQRQLIGWARGRAWLGVLASALIFGGAHAYQGARSMALLAVFGALFGVLALYRRSLRAGMFAHAWHDWIAGLALALLRANHVI
jgi:membrane protease YdiL (CAAX protease family)